LPRGPGWCVTEPLDGALDRILEVLSAPEVERLIASASTRGGTRSPKRRVAQAHAAPPSRLRRRRVAARDPMGGGGTARARRRRTAPRPSDDWPGATDATNLRDAIAAHAERPRRPNGPRPVRPGILVTIDAHGSDEQPLRDPILRGWRIVA
jgi:hypothetical protein